MKFKNTNRKIAPFFSVFFLVWITGCTSSDAEMTIDGSSKESFNRSIKAMADSFKTNEQKKKFSLQLLGLSIEKYPPAADTNGFQRLALGAKALEAAPINMDGVTLSEIMAFNPQSQDSSKQKVKDNDPVCAADRSSKILSLDKWTIQPIDSDTNKITNVLKNISGKTIRIVDGSIGFSDALGQHIGSMGIPVDLNLKHGGTFEESRHWGPYTFERLLKLKQEHVITKVCVASVMFEDGTIQKFGQ